MRKLFEIAFVLIFMASCCGNKTTVCMEGGDPALTEGKKVQIFTSSEGVNEMLVEQESIIFQQDYETENLLINIYPEFKYQQILGFGAAFTESSAVNFSLLSPDDQKKVI